jgi:hypothetical protein
MAVTSKPTVHKREHWHAGKNAGMNGNPLRSWKGDGAVAHWLQDRAAAAFDALQADPKSAVTADQIRKHLAREHIKVRYCAALLNKEY